MAGEQSDKQLDDVHPVYWATAQLAEGRGQLTGRAQLGTVTFGGRVSSDFWLNGRFASHLLFPAWICCWNSFITTLLANRISLGP